MITSNTFKGKHKQLTRIASNLAYYNIAFNKGDYLFSLASISLMEKNFESTIKHYHLLFVATFSGIYKIWRG